MYKPSNRYLESVGLVKKSRISSDFFEELLDKDCITKDDFRSVILINLKGLENYKKQKNE